MKIAVVKYFLGIFSTLSTLITTREEELQEKLKTKGTPQNQSIQISNLDLNYSSFKYLTLTFPKDLHLLMTTSL